MGPCRECPKYKSKWLLHATLNHISVFWELLLRLNRSDASLGKYGVVVRSKLNHHKHKSFIVNGFWIVRIHVGTLLLWGTR
jgi:hypothetical protein